MDAKAFGKSLALRAGVFVVSLWACFGVAHAANAASLYVSPSTGTFTAGQTITVGVYVSSADQAMNAVSAALNFSSSTLQVTSIGTSGSIVNLWAVQPTYSNSAGTVSFEGVVVNPGYTGTSGKIATITFSTKAAGTGTLSFTSGSVLANDGKGTQIYSGSSGTSVTIKAPVVVPAKPTAPVTPTTPAKPTTSTAPATPATPAAPATPSTPVPTAIPTITSYPTSVHAGESITVAGLSQAGNTIEVVYDTGGGTRTIVTVATDDAGAYTATMVNGVSGFTYKIWAEAIAPDGTRSAASRIVTTTMEAPPPIEEIPVTPQVPETTTVVVQPSTSIDVHTFQLLTWAVVMLSAFAVLALLFMLGLGIRKIWRMRRYQVLLVPRVPHHPFMRAARAFKGAIGALRKDVHAVDAVRHDPTVAGALTGELHALRVEVDGEFAALESEIAAKSVSAPRNVPPPAA